MESDTGVKTSKYGYDPFKICKKCFYCVNPMSHSKTGINYRCPVPKENHANASGSAG